MRDVCILERLYYYAFRMSNAIILSVVVFLFKPFSKLIHSLGSLHNHCLKRHKGALQHQKIPLDLNLVVTQYTNDCITPGVYSLTEHGIYDGRESSTDGLNYSLRADGDTRQNGIGQSDEDKFICSQSIHLEGSPYGGDRITIHAHRYDSEASCSSKTRKNDSFEWIPKFQPLKDGKACLFGLNHFYQEVEQCHEELSCNNKLSQRKFFTSPEVEKLDLNKPLPKESPYRPFDPFQVGEYGKVNKFTILNEAMNNYSTNSCTLSPQDKTLSYTTSKHLDFRPQNASMSELNAKKKEDKMCSKEELVEGTNSNRSPVSCKSNLIVDDILSKKMGVVSLLYLSSQCLTTNQDYSKEVPQSSSESYESIMLKQEHCNIDEYCISSTPFKEIELVKNKHDVKLKRGRRMKNFRKEILPNLWSLSGKEISEDIKTMDIALRSREYKKYRSKISSKSR